MKRIWLTLCAAALLALPLGGCAGNPTGSGMDTNTPSASPSPSAGALPSLDHNNGSDDLADGDGIVGGEDRDGTVDHSGAPGAGAGNTGNEHAAGSALDDAGRAIRNTLDDMGDAARDMGRDAKRAIER